MNVILNSNHTSYKLALTQLTCGVSELRPADLLEMVSRVVTPRATLPSTTVTVVMVAADNTDLPGTCSTSIQKLTQDTITMRMVGTQLWTRWKPILRCSWNLAARQLQLPDSQLVNSCFMIHLNSLFTKYFNLSMFSLLNMRLSPC